MRDRDGVCVPECECVKQSGICIIAWRKTAPLIANAYRRVECATAPGAEDATETHAVLVQEPKQAQQQQQETQTKRSAERVKRTRVTIDVTVGAANNVCANRS